MKRPTFDSEIKMLPDSFGRESENLITDNWILLSVVAPQPRSNFTIFKLPLALLI